MKILIDYPISISNKMANYQIDEILKKWIHEFWKITWNWQKMTIFVWFGGSAALAEASAELFRPKLTEASAEASVSVVH